MQRPTVEIALNIDVACYLRKDTLTVGTTYRSAATPTCFIIC
jgi:hypothetical protein